MNRFIKITALTIAVAAGAATAQADSLLDDLAMKGKIITTHGVWGR